MISFNIQIEDLSGEFPTQNFNISNLNNFKIHDYKYTNETSITINLDNSSYNW